MSVLLENPTKPEAPIANRVSRRLLLIAYNFPPVGGAGVQRPVKWVKNLSQLGWDVTVLTTSNPSVPARDESLLADIPDHVRVVRARTWEPGYQTKQELVSTAAGDSTGPISRLKMFARGLAKRAVKLLLQPDPQVLWVPNAVQAGRRILRGLKHDVILVTAPAYSSFFIGTALKRQFNLPLVLDFRDEWDLSGEYLENAQRDVISRFIQHRMQRYVLKRADAVVATTNASSANLTEKLRCDQPIGVGRKVQSRTVAPDDMKPAWPRAVTIYNGFDAEDFSNESEWKPAHQSGENSTAGSFRLLYTGTLWNLTTIQPLVEAVLLLNAKSPDLVEKLELVCVGRKTAEQAALLARLKATACRLVLIDYCDHSKVLDMLRSASAVCLLLSDVPGAERVVPAKLFEYFASRKDLLAITPNGETADIVNRIFPQAAIAPGNIDSIVEWLESRLSAKTDADRQVLRHVNIDEYSRMSQTKRLVELLNGLIETRNVNGKVGR